MVPRLRGLRTLMAHVRPALRVSHCQNYGRAQSQRSTPVLTVVGAVSASASRVAGADGVGAGAVPALRGT